MEMPKPGPAEKQLAKLAGNWVGDEKLNPSPYDPQGGPAVGKVTNRIALDGWAVVQDYEQIRNGQTSFRGHGVFSHDAAKSQAQLAWYDSCSGGPQLFHGTWKGDVLTMSSVGPTGHCRCAFDVSGGGYKFSMDVSEDGKQWFPFMSGSYRRS